MSQSGMSFKLICSGLNSRIVVRGDQRHGEGRTGKQCEEGKEGCREARNGKEGRR